MKCKSLGCDCEVDVYGQYCEGCEQEIIGKMRIDNNQWARISEIIHDRRGE